MLKDKGFVLDIYEAACHIGQFVHLMDLDDFERDAKTQAAVIQKIMVMGEAVKCISNDFKSAYPTIPWREIAGMRDKLVHEYRKIDLETVWMTATINVPQLIQPLEHALQA